MGFSSVAAFADADPDNHGHHYGQLKHRQTPPPAPAPTPSSAPATLPTTPPAANTAAASGTTTTIIDIDIPSAVAAPIADSQAKPIKLVASSPTPEGGQPWLVLLLLPTLLAAWLMVFARATINASRRFIQSRAAA
jgi:hypothetical protein